MHSRSLLNVAVLLSLTTVSSACGQTTTPTDACTREALKPPSPIATVEPTCIADYPQYASAADLLTRADLVVRVTATGPSRDYDQYPLTRASDGSFVSGSEMSPEERQQRDLLASPATAISVRVEEVLKGAAAVGDVLEINQNPCTERPLPVGADVQYVLALEDLQLGPSTPFNQLNDSQAAWQVTDDGTLVPVNPDNDLGVTSVSQFAELAA